MQRLNVEKNEAVADLIERILEVQEQQIVLVVPKGSHLIDSPSNFRLIAREAGVLAKNISVESVDQDVLAHARAAGMSANHPLFDDPLKSADSQSLSDIRPRGAKARPVAEKKLKVRPQPQPEPEEEDVSEMEEEVQAEPVVVEEEDVAEDDIYEEPTRRQKDNEERYDTLEPRPRRSRKVLVWSLVALLLIAGGMWLTASAFGKATVNIAFNETPWTYDGIVTAAVAAKDMNADSATIPAEMVEQPQNLSSKSFPATGHTAGGQKAQGTITIFNNYSGASQELVATTRFLTPDGKMYRLDNGTIVPGAKVDGEGKVVEASSIKATVTADKPGEEYNVGSVPRLNIPGFQGTPKYDGFYGVLSDGASGGSSTGGAAPTDEDIRKAKSEMSSALSSAFQATFLASVPDDLKVLPDALVFSTTTFSVGRVDSQNQFSVTPSSILRAFEFREADVVAFLNAKAQTEGQGKVLQDLKINYSNVKPNFTKKEMTFTVQATGSLAPQFDADSFAAGIAGKSQNEARQAILALPDLADAKVSLWPAWLWSLPKNSSKIRVEVQ